MFFHLKLESVLKLGNKFRQAFRNLSLIRFGKKHNLWETFIEHVLCTAELWYYFSIRSRTEKQEKCEGNKSIECTGIQNPDVKRVTEDASLVILFNLKAFTSLLFIAIVLSLSYSIFFSFPFSTCLSGSSMAAHTDDEFGEKTVSVLLDGEESEIVFIDHPSSEMSVSFVRFSVSIRFASQFLCS